MGVIGVTAPYAETPTMVVRDATTGKSMKENSRRLTIEEFLGRDLDVLEKKHAPRVAVIRPRQPNQRG